MIVVLLLSVVALVAMIGGVYRLNRYSDARIHVHEWHAGHLIEVDAYESGKDR